MHENSLISEYSHFVEDGSLHNVEDLEEHSELFDHIVSDDVKEIIQTASRESSAISAALGMERNTKDLYMRRAEESDYQKEKELYEYLAHFEQDHIKYLSDLNRKIIQSAFFDGVE
jgi:rubrerythrin